jgi:hypothetical protein
MNRFLPSFGMAGAILYFLLFLFSAQAQGDHKKAEKKNIQVKPEIELVPVYEKTFDEPIVDVIFDTATVTLEEALRMGWKEEGFSSEGKKRGKIKISYPKVVLIGETRDEIKEMVFYDKKGREVKSIFVDSRNNVITSNSGRFLLIATYYDEYRTEKGDGTLLDWHGNMVWEKEKGYFTSVSDDGYTAEGFVSPSGDLVPFTLYNPKGEKIKEISLDYLNVLDAGGRFWNGDYTICYGNAMYPTTVKVYSYQGEVKIEKELPGRVLPSEVVTVSNMGVITHLMSIEPDESSIVFLGWDGKIKWTTSLGRILVGYRTLWVSDSKDKIFVYATSDGHLLSIETTSGTIIDDLEIGQHLRVDKGFYWKIESGKLTIFILKEANR